MIEGEQVLEIMKELENSSIEDVEKQFGSVEEQFGSLVNKIVKVIREYPNASPTKVRAEIYNDTLCNDLV